MIEIPIADAPDQTLAAVLGGRRCSFRFRYNVSSDRWSFDLSVDDSPVLTGRRVVLNTDLLAAMSLGLGRLYAIPSGDVVDPGRSSLPSGAVRLYHVSETEAQALGI